MLALVISVSALLEAAQNLKSEDRENPEYDRALLELVSDATGLSKEETAEHLGIPLGHVYGSPSRA